MTQQTAVEWFAKEAAKLLFDLKKNNDTFQLELCLYGLNQLEEQAKQIFEEQIIDAYENGVGDENERNLSGQFTNAEQYYTKTYGNNQNKPMDKFKKEILEFHLPDNFKGMTKDYIMNVIFDKILQSKWNPQIGDVIVGCTGNIFVISAEHNLVPELGGKLFFFGGGLCSRDGGNIMNETYAFTMNESGKWYAYGKNGMEEKHNLNHSSWKDFRFVPYPHELSKY